MDQRSRWVATSGIRSPPQDPSLLCRAEWLHYVEQNGSVFAYLEAPLAQKNLVWAADPADLLASDIDPYRLQHETHHNSGDLNLNYGTATDSEKVIFLNILNLATETKTKNVQDENGVEQTVEVSKRKVENGDKALELNFGGTFDGAASTTAGGSSDLKDGFEQFRDSVDYVQLNALCSEALCLQRDRTMAFEIQFTMSLVDFEAAISEVAGLSFHLSPERGLPLPNENVAPVPVPAALPLFVTGLVVFGFAGRRAKRSSAA